jgi:hypothetical protein
MTQSLFSEHLSDEELLWQSWSKCQTSDQSTEDAIWQAFSGRFSTSGRVTSDGLCWTRSLSESLNPEIESSLLLILEENVPEKYYLSPRACAGMLRRAERRGKTLPLLLTLALEVAQRTHFTSSLSSTTEEGGAMEH